MPSAPEGRSDRENREHRHRQHDLAARQPHRERHRADRCLYGCLRQVSNDAEQALASTELRACKAEHNTCCTENQCCKHHQNRCETGLGYISDVNCGTDEHKQNELRCNPELSELFAEACANFAGRFGVTSARRMATASRPESAILPLRTVSSATSRKETLSTMITLTLPRTMWLRAKCRFKISFSYISAAAPTAIPSTTETGMFRKSAALAFPPCAIPVKVVNSTIT